MAAATMSALFCRILKVSEHLPKMAMVPPVFVKTPQAFEFLFVMVFCIADTNPPAAPVIMVPLMAALTASFG
jgi:hypothetical protein